jgi:hypothetical protein
MTGWVHNMRKNCERADFGMDKCVQCGKMVMGYEKEKHSANVHQGAAVEFTKIGK